MGVYDRQHQALAAAPPCPPSLGTPSPAPAGVGVAVAPRSSSPRHAPASTVFQSLVCTFGRLVSCLRGHLLPDSFFPLLFSPFL